MLRVGSVPYLVARPLDEALEDEPGIDLVRLVPAKLAEGLRQGELDVALVSSIELFRHEGTTWLDGPAVTGEGAVRSVQVFLRRDLEEVRAIALDPSSRMAATLVQIIWPTGPGGRPEFVAVEPGRDPREVEADAWLRIGDAALREHLEPGSPPVFNPSAAWVELTGEICPFALWIARPGVDLRPHAEAFVRAWERGRGRIDELARQAARDWKVPLEAAARYLGEEILYDPGARLGPALEAFRDRAAELGLADGDLSPRGVSARQAERHA
ncbi:MAG: menaquinone biosynthesis protein [Planctomycetota bacterium]|nr:menaquinone biosynthesis protein [Planctomycetota bacterium]